MSAYYRLNKKPATFRQLTGLSLPEFDKLLAELAVVRQARREQQQQRRPRRRRPGGGRRPKLALADQLLLVLIYYRTYVTQDFLGFLFQIDKGTACRILQAVGLELVGLFRIPETKVQIHPDEIAEAFVDATEQATYRPQKHQRRSYSGKKKRHTVKHQVVVVRKKKQRGRKKQARKVRIAAVSAGAKGKVHDKKLYDQSRLQIPPGVQKIGDGGYQGTDLTVPQKKPRGGKLSQRAQRRNRRLSKKRIVVEHGIGKMKIWRIAADRYRNPQRGHTRMMKNVAGLHNRMFG